MTVCGSNDRLCTPRLRQAASPLAAMRRERRRESTASNKDYKPTMQWKKFENNKMRQTFYILTVSFFMISCATSINQPYKNVKVNSTKPEGEIHLHLSLPFINSFCLKPENEARKVSTGFWGLAIGLDYYHLKNQFISLGTSGVLGIPVLGAVDYSGEHELMNSLCFSLSNNHKLKRFSIGYGLSYARNTWDFRYDDRFDPPPPTRDPIKRSHNAFGFIFPTYFQIGKCFNIGVVYRPTYYRPNLTDKFSYEHLISVDFAWKIGLKK